MMTRVLTAIALVGALAAPAAAADKANLQLFKDVQKQVLTYSWFSIFDNVESQINDGVYAYIPCCFEFVDRRQRSSPCC